MLSRRKLFTNLLGMVSCDKSLFLFDNYVCTWICLEIFQDNSHTKVNILWKLHFFNIFDFYLVTKGPQFLPPHLAFVHTDIFPLDSLKTPQPLQDIELRQLQS